jgi:isocitrate dehydrogenase kinase/phosphatase
MQKTYTDSRLANLGAGIINKGYRNYRHQFTTITERAKTRFEFLDWIGMQRDTRQRLELYRTVVQEVVAEVRELLGDRVNDTLLWISIKAVYSGLSADRNDWELAETFFNSITRRIFASVGMDHQIEFKDSDFDTPPTRSRLPVYKEIKPIHSTVELIETILSNFEFQVPYQDVRRDAGLVAARVEERMHEVNMPAIERAELLQSVFYRGKGAYLIARLMHGNDCIPLALALLNTSDGIMVNAVLLTEHDIHILFSLTHSYFHVMVNRPYDLVQYLLTLLPQKHVSEVYTALGYNKHGKTELFRELTSHLETAEDQFEIAKGERGKVMLVFTLPSFNMVFKIIKDRFAYPKDITRQAVMQQYRLVFQHDRAGRLIDAQEFEHIRFHRHLFTPALLEELAREAAQTVYIEDDYVIIKHVYIERRVIPLNLYLHQVSEEKAKEAVVECGNTIKDLAATNIFTGDMLLKNFGVTRHGRVVFYDYDELCWLVSCNFRALPQSRTYDEEMSDEPWFRVGEDDVFPEEFPRFLGLSGALREHFNEHHSDLFDAAYWQRMQERQRAAEIIDIFPYDENNHLPGQRRDEYIFSSMAYAKPLPESEVA